MQTWFFQILAISAALTLPTTSYADQEHDTTYRNRGDIAVEVTAGLAAGYGLVGGSVMVAATDNLDLGISTGGDILNIHTGVRANYYIDQSGSTPLLYATLGRSQYKDERSLYAAGGAGVEFRSESGFYYQATGGFAFYLDGHNAEGNAPGFFEIRPLTLGFRF